MKDSPTKRKVVEAASSLFYQKGFHGTSVRDIAEKASVNVSSISYYFKGKQGLLEYAVSRYYEEYLAIIEATLEESGDDTPNEKLKKLIHKIIQYKHSNLQLSCFIHRELSMDSVFVREMVVTYLAKENFIIGNAFSAVVKGSNADKQKLDRQFLLMQLKGMLVTPYVLHNEWRSQVVGDYSHSLFVTKYVQTIHQWIDYITR
ncbi:forespore capture DNA-binding protein RefZ [Ornithinibacillus sp. BX22]|uniref:Forespore capture DNA-binding protein RefZ n=2 Tax=Ornithinibacillus TaxID=484508 RepID=A0A923L8X2_9BACI|nr:MULTISPECIES: forespore capture DNA-binding protein RefZ [Ornithinibacillus]MBC5638638.1 forespore capture DNA-binding protein RefZ [Ornithinibacillus hominis]MBS3682007.1 forespore capture DNA-binding protein RefZ [Ornithinibacillus massiliensis]